MEAGLEDATAAFELKLVAQASPEHTPAVTSPQSDHYDFVRSAEWSPDGTCVIVNSSDNCIKTFIVPPELLDQRDYPLKLEPYSIIRSREPADALACYPNYNLENASTTLVLSATNEHPIRLHSTLTGDLVASYPLINSTTEAFIKPQSMTFNINGTHFVAGSQSLISTFDLSRIGSGPVSSLKTGPKRSKSLWSNPNTCLRGLLSALAIDNQFNVLAAGTLSRQVGLYDAAGSGECVGVFSVSGTDADKVISGNGITQLLWSKCGRYLYVVERKSDGVLVYDIRKSGHLLSWVSGRAATTNQRMTVEMVGDTAYDLWAGDQEGNVRCWAAPHLREGAVSPAATSCVHKDLVNSVSMHQSEDVLLTAAGQRKLPDMTLLEPLEHSPSEERDRLLKIWYRTRRESDSQAYQSPPY